MKKHNTARKLLSVILTLAMVFGLSVNAFASWQPYNGGTGTACLKVVRGSDDDWWERAGVKFDLKTLTPGVQYKVAIDFHKLLIKVRVCPQLLRLGRK